MSVTDILRLAIDSKNLPRVGADGNSPVQPILSIVFGIVGALSLLMITIGGFKYVVSRGDPQNIAKAKETIIYAAIGLVVALSAFAIVSFVFNNIG